LTAIASSENRAKACAPWHRGRIGFVLTCLTVSWWRPSNFQLGRLAPVTILRAPELFIPILIAGISVVVLWFFACNYERHFCRSLALLLTFLALDLCLWGQSERLASLADARPSALA